MEKVLLNSDLLNDCESVYFQIDKFAFVKFQAKETGDFLSFFSGCQKKIEEQGIEHKALFVPFNIYNNVVCLMQDSPLFDLTDTFESALWNVGVDTRNVVVYIPDRLKNMAKI